MKHFVVGLGFTADASQVLLIRKNRPDFLAGFLNGHGGAVEEGETPAQALAREGNEECLIDIPAESWKRIARMRDDKRHIDVFSCFNDIVLKAQQGTDETLHILSVNDPRIAAEGVPQLDVLLKRALHRDCDNILDLPTVNALRNSRQSLACR